MRISRYDEAESGELCCRLVNTFSATESTKNLENSFCRILIKEIMSVLATFYGKERNPENWGCFS